MKNLFNKAAILSLIIFSLSACSDSSDEEFRPEKSSIEKVKSDSQGHGRSKGSEDGD